MQAISYATTMPQKTHLLFKCELHLGYRIALARPGHQLLREKVYEEVYGFVAS